MKTNDEALLKIKYDVLRTVSKLAFEGRLEEERDNIPFKLIPGPKAQFRCCVWVKPVRTHVTLVRSRSAVTVPILIRVSVKSADAVLSHVRTMRSLS